MNNDDINKPLLDIVYTISPVLKDSSEIGVRNHLTTLYGDTFKVVNDIRLHATFKCDFNKLLKSIWGLLEYYQLNKSILSRANWSESRRELTNFLLGVGILRYQLYSYLYKSGIVNADYAAKDKPGLLKILRSILNEFDVRRKVSDVIYLYYIPKIMPRGACSPDGIELFPANGEMIGLYKDITTVSETLPQSRDHSHCPLLFPIHEYVRKRDMRLHEEYLPIIFGNKPIEKMETLSRYMDEFHKLVCSKKFVESVQSAGNHFTEVDISLLDNILAIKRIGHLKLIK